MAFSWLRRNRENQETQPAPQQSAGNVQQAAPQQKDRGWNLWTRVMNTISGGKLYSYEKEQHDQRVARRAAQKKHEDDVSKIVVDDINENEIVSTPTASPERQKEIHRQMVDYASMQYKRTKAVNQFKQQNSDPDQDATTGAGSIGGRMLQGFYQDGESEETQTHNLNALQAIRSTMGGQRKVESIDEIKPTADQDDPPELGRAKQIRAVVVPILSELRDIESGEGFQSVAAASYGRAKQLVGEINSMQDLLKYFCANDTVKDYMYQFCYSSKEEYKRLTMGMSMALSRTGKSLGNELGMDNISAFQNRVGTRTKEELDWISGNKRQAQYSALKNNQHSFLETKGQGNQDDAHRRAYLDLSFLDKSRLNKKQRALCGMWISSSGSFSNILRNDKSIEEQCAPGSQYAEMKENIAIMDSIFDDSRGLEEDLEVFRGVGDGFLSMLFQKIGLAPSEYAKKDGSLDYRKIDKEGQMQKLVGVVYTDQCYVSTTTNRGYAASWASDAEHYNAAVSEVMAAHNMTNISGSEYFVPGSAANEERIKIEGEINQKLETSKAGAHMMIMQVPAKTKGIFMDAMGSGKDVRDYRAAAAQNELTLDRGLLYKIDGVSGSAGNYQFQVSVIGQGPKKAGAKYDPKTETHERLKQPAMATGIQDV